MRRLTLVKTVLGSLKLHPGRAVLTALGIMIGVGSVIRVIAIGAGSRQQLEQRLQSIGANLLLVLLGTASGSRGQNRYTKTLLTSADSEARRPNAIGL
jgi:ABC-type antimicrobial peptide transport system permease subunit